MEEKIMAILLEINQKFDEFHQEVNQRFDSFEQKIDEKMDEKIRASEERMIQKIKESEERMNQKLTESEDRIEQRMNQKLTEFEQQVNQKIKESEKRILDQYFLFENEYGIKIDAIFDAVTLELDKNLEKSKKIGKLEERMDQNDVAMFQYEKRISALELRQ